MTKETVILLHGIFRGSGSMWPLQKYLEYLGYTVLNISYPARRYTLQELTKILDTRIKTHKNFDADSVLHFVTHSLGGLLARYYIRDYCPKHMGRVVMLGPPNTGSEWADFMSAGKILKHIYRLAFGPAGEQLLTTHVHDDDCGTADYELGVIAGNKSAVPFAGYVLNGDHDGMVPVERTRHPKMKDHLIMDATHTYMMMKPGIMKKVAKFLKDATFE